MRGHVRIECDMEVPLRYTCSCTFTYLCNKPDRFRTVPFVVCVHNLYQVSKYGAFLISLLRTWEGSSMVILPQQMLPLIFVTSFSPTMIVHKRCHRQLLVACHENRTGSHASLSAPAFPSIVHMPVSTAPNQRSLGTSHNSNMRPSGTQVTGPVIPESGHWFQSYECKSGLTHVGNDSELPSK